MELVRNKHNKAVMNSVLQYFACDLIHSIIMDAHAKYCRIEFITVRG